MRNCFFILTQIQRVKKLTNKKINFTEDTNIIFITVFFYLNKFCVLQGFFLKILLKRCYKMVSDLIEKHNISIIWHQYIRATFISTIPSINVCLLKFQNIHSKRTDLSKNVYLKKLWIYSVDRFSSAIDQFNSLTHFV